jgi:hypothetical protein
MRKVSGGQPLPKTWEELHKQALDRRGRPVRSLRVVFGGRTDKFPV